MFKAKSWPYERHVVCKVEKPENQMQAVLDRFAEKKLPAKPEFHDPFLDGNEVIEAIISAYHAEATKGHLCAVLDAIRQGGLPGASGEAAPWRKNNGSVCCHPRSAASFRKEVMQQTREQNLPSL